MNHARQMLVNPRLLTTALRVPKRRWESTLSDTEDGLKISRNPKNSSFGIDIGWNKDLSIEEQKNWADSSTTLVTRITHPGAWRIILKASGGALADIGVRCSVDDTWASDADKLAVGRELDGAVIDLALSMDRACDLSISIDLSGESDTAVIHWAAVLDEASCAMLQNLGLDWFDGGTAPLRGGGIRSSHPRVARPLDWGLAA